MGGNGLGPEMGNFRTWSRRERQRPVAAVIVVAKHCVIDPFLIHSSAPTSGISIFPYLSAYMKREFQKDVSPQMQVWLAALHLRECILDNFFFSSQRINTTPKTFFASEDQHRAQKNHICKVFVGILKNYRLIYCTGRKSKIWQRVFPGESFSNLMSNVLLEK